MDYFAVLVKRGVKLRVFTKPVREQTGDMADQAAMVIAGLKELGAEVINKEKMHQKIALLDERIVWEGSLNILSHRDTGEQMRRFEGPSTAKDIIDKLELDKETGIGTFTGDKCPECGGDLVVRNGPHGRFMGCSNYPTGCRHKRPLAGQRRQNPPPGNTRSRGRGRGRGRQRDDG